MTKKLEDKQKYVDWLIEQTIEHTEYEIYYTESKKHDICASNRWMSVYKYFTIDKFIIWAEKQLDWTHKCEDSVFEINVKTKEMHCLVCGKKAK